jgi:hypothetical protein
MADDEQPDHTEDPRKQETGTGGYPESTPGGSEGDDADRKAGGDGSAAGAPSHADQDESDREKTTGNPNAAG